MDSPVLSKYLIAAIGLHSGWGGTGRTNERDERDGLWQFHFADGARCQLTYSDGVLHGRCDFFDADGAAEVGEFKDGELDGDFAAYDPTGRLTSHEQWMGGRLNGLRVSVDAVLNEIRRSHYVRGSKHGEESVFAGDEFEIFTSGDMVRIVHGAYENGVKNGVWEYWHRDGAPLKKEHWHHGELERVD